MLLLATLFFGVLSGSSLSRSWEALVSKEGRGSFFDAVKLPTTVFNER